MILPTYMLQHPQLVYEIGSLGDKTGTIRVQANAIVKPQVIGTTISFIFLRQLGVATIVRASFHIIWFWGPEAIWHNCWDLLRL